MARPGGEQTEYRPIGAVCPKSVDRRPFFRYSGVERGEGHEGRAAHRPGVKALAARLEGGGVLVGWQGGRAVPLAAEDILRCYGEEKGVKCQTPGGVYDLKERLYELEGRLDRHTFVRISHSEIISLRKITALDLSLTGTIRVTLEGGAVSYVSRRYVRKIKEALGL